MLMVVDEMMLCNVGENVIGISLVGFVSKRDFSYDFEEDNLSLLVAGIFSYTDVVCNRKL